MKVLALSFIGWAVLALGSGVVSAQQATTNAEIGVELMWRGGEKLSGRVMGAGKETLLFMPEVSAAAGLFLEPAEIRLERVEELKITSEDGIGRAEAFWVRLHDGSRLLADVVGLDDGWLKLRSGLLGAGAEIRLADVASMERVQGDGVLFFGAGPGPSWTESPRVEEGVAVGVEDPFAVAPAAAPALRVRRVNRSRQVKGSEPGQMLQLWQRIPEGGLRTLSWASSLSAPLVEEVAKALPQKLRLDLRLRAERSPQFAFKLVTKAAELRVETWENRLVLREGDRYQVATESLLAEKKELRVSVLWDTLTHEAWLLSESGEEIAKLSAIDSNQVRESGPKEGDGRDPFGNRPVEIPGGVGVILENLGMDLTLEAVNLTRWEGQIPDAEPAGEAFARLANGRVVRGSWRSMQEGKIVLQGATGSEVIQVPLSEVIRIEPGPTQGRSLTRGRAGDSGPGVEIFSRQGEWLRGGFMGIHELPDWRMELSHASFRGRCSALLAALRSVVWTEELSDQETVLPSFPERLQVGADWVRGRVVAEGDVLPCWLFDGAVKPVPLNPQKQTVIERDPKSIPADLIDLPEGMTFIAMKSGDLLPARVNALNQAGLAFAAPGVLPLTMARAEVLGVLIPGKKLVTEGFQDADWRQLRGDSAILQPGEHSEILLQPDHALGHPAMMEGDGLDLVLKEAAADEGLNGVLSLRLTLFLRNLEANEASLRLLVAFVGDEIYCGDETSDGQLRHQGQAMRTGPEARVQVRALADRLLVRVNGSEVVSIPLTPEMRVGSGLILEPGELWGNPAQALQISGFSARKAEHRGQVPQVDEEARRQVLTIPRARSAELPEQVLIAPTGDLLRGTVESWNAQDMELRWGLDTLRVPRERVAAVVLLDPPAPDPAKSKEAAAIPPVMMKKGGAAPHWLLLANGGRLGLTLSRWSENGVMGRHASLGRVIVPAAAVRSLWVNQLPPETETLRAITGWQIKLAEEPEIAEVPGTEAAQVGTEAKTFSLPLLEGGEFVLEKQRGKVVVLDFWASWCAPCLKALPELMEALKAMPSDQVHLIGVNQGEPAPHVSTFLTTRRWSLTTVLDVDQMVGKAFGVEGIPHTVVIGQDGKVALVKTGYSAEAAGEIAAKVRELLQEK